MLLHSSPKARYVKSEKDLYHIETDRKGGYIEFAARQIYRAEQSEAYRPIASVGTGAVLVKKKGHRTFYILCPFFKLEHPYNHQKRKHECKHAYDHTKDVQKLDAKGKRNYRFLSKAVLYLVVGHGGVALYEGGDP